MTALGWIRSEKLGSLRIRYQKWPPLERRLDSARQPRPSECLPPRIKLEAVRKASERPMPKDVASLDTIDDDTLILIFSFLAVPDILVMRQVRSLYLSLISIDTARLGDGRHPNGWPKFRLSISCGAILAYLLCCRMATLSHNYR
jgi:hypothetical protein